MAATLALVAFLLVLFGGLTLALSYGYLSVERERERAARSEHDAEAVRAADSTVSVPDFVVAVRPVATPVAFAFDEAFVLRLEKHVRAEQALVAQFIHHPSIDNLYRQTGASVHVH